MPQESSRLKVSVRDGVTIVGFADKKILDEISISEIGQQLSALAAGAGQPRLVLDFDGVSHMSSSALGMLITIHKRIREKSGELRLANIEPKIHEVFVITRLNEIFEIHGSLAEALGSLGVQEA